MDISNEKIRDLIEYAVDNGHRVKVFEKTVSVDIEPLHSYVLFFPVSSGDVCIIKYYYSDSDTNNCGKLTVDEFKQLFAPKSGS
ncbi:hypothetical protein FZF52_02600 [Salmonella enterica]|nr:hypothetical protein [Salmonella enterica]